MKALGFFFSLLISLISAAQCVVPIPYSENFNSSSWVIPATTALPGSVAPCWTRTPNTNTYMWVPGPSTVVNNFTGPATDVSGNGKFMYTETVTFSNPPNPALLLTPFLNLATATAPQVSFYYYMYGSQVGTLTVQASNGGPWSTLGTISGQQQTNNSSAWVKVTYPLTTFAGDTVRIRFQGTKASLSNLSRIAIDEIVVEEAPTCLPVTNIYTTGTTANSTNVGWFAGSTSSTSWEIEYGPLGFTPGTGTTVTVTTNPALITGLSGSTSYAFYVREVCSPTDKSPWEGPQITTTSCASPITPPYTENFDGPFWQPYVNTLNFGSIGPCWTSNPTGTFSYQWLVNPNLLFNNNTGPDGDHTTGTGKYVAMQTVAGSNLNAVLRTPQFNLAAITSPELTFWYHMYGSGITKLEVDIQVVGGSGWTNLLTINGQQQTSSSALWQKAIISLTAYASNAVYIRFRGTRNSTSTQSAKIAIDDLSILPGSSCPIPTSLVVNNIVSNSAQVNFTGTPGGQYQVKYGLQGFNVNNQGVSVLTPSSPVTIQPLTQNTTYQVYVRKICSNDTSSWNGPITFVTPCLVNAPYTEPFTSASWVVSGTFPNLLGDIDACYTRTVDNTYFWGPGPETFPSFQTGPSGDHTTGSGKYLFANTQAFGGTTPLIAQFVTPQINLVPLNTPELSFWYHMYGSDIGSLIVQINNGGTTWTTIKTITGQQQTSKTAPWLEEVINLSAYADDTVRIRFRASKNMNTFNAEVAIDDIDIHELPSCPKPTSFTATNATFNSVNLSWVTGGASNWIIKYGAPGFSSGTFVASATNPRVLTGLTPNTNYEVWVRDSCSNVSVSQWVGPVYFRTACNPNMAPFTENFSGTSFAPWTFTNQSGSVDGCYRRSDSTDYYWVIGPPPFASFQTGPSGDKTTGSGKYLYTRTNFFPQNGVSTNIVSPFIDLGNIIQPQLRFWYHMYGTNIDKLEVRVRRYDGSTQLVKTISGQTQFTSTAAWLQEVVDLSAFTGDTIRVIFTGFNLGGGVRCEIALDDIEIGIPQACPVPSNLAISNVTASTATLSWTSTASASGSVIEYGPTGFTPGTGTLIHNVTSPHIVTGLLPLTAYQFYVQDSCGWGGLSAQIGPQAATTLSCPPTIASFTFTVNGLTASFDASASTGNVTSYSWSFGDATTGTGATINHSYITGGSYIVTLVVTNACGSTDTIAQTINACTPISGQFTTGISGLTVNFSTASVLGSGLQFSWLYGDGNSGTGPAPSHTYLIDGAYVVQLIVTDLCGVVDTITQTVTVCAPLTPVIVFTQNGLDVNFSVSGANGGTNYNWNFGDGNTGSGPTPMHTYATTGTYNVSVVVTNLCGQQVSVNTFVTLCELPSANWTFTIISSNSSGMTVQFNGTASIGASSYLWEFGDGSTNNTSAIPVHTYVPAGLFWIVTLTVFNDCGDQAVTRSSLASVGIDDFGIAGVKSFPNPADDQVVLFVPEFIKVHSVALVGTDGKILANNAQSTQGEVHFDTADLPEGVYYLRLFSDAGEATFKVIIQH